jgi:hypothetical protein
MVLCQDAVMKKTKVFNETCSRMPLTYSPDPLHVLISLDYYQCGI